MICTCENFKQLIFGLLLSIYGCYASAQPPNLSCLNQAASYHGVHPNLLLAILKVESGLNPNAIGRNQNGTIDIGIGQINSMHLDELKRYGLNSHHLLDACNATYVSAWFLRRGFDRYGYSWFAAATYHSTTPKHNQHYQKLLLAELSRQGVEPSTVLAPR
jgi:soluble lytic murein transglycosylase-like protein